MKQTGTLVRYIFCSSSSSSKCHVSYPSSHNHGSVENSPFGVETSHTSSVRTPFSTSMLTGGRVSHNIRGSCSTLCELIGSLGFSCNISVGLSPLPSNSDHQDYYIFCRESRTKPSFATITGKGGQPKTYQFVVQHFEGK